MRIIGNKRITFVLEGIFGVYNYGCEAIVRGTAVIIWHYWPDARIVYRSHRVAEDAVALKDIKVEVLPVLIQEKPKSIFERIWNKLVSQQRTSDPRYDWVKQGDVIMSIGGDILTLAPDQRTGDATIFWQVDHCRHIQSYGLPVILWGASVGPFDENPHASQAFTEILRNFRLITIREEISEKYLAQLKVVGNVLRVADPAFLMEPISSVECLGNMFTVSERPTIGVNLSPLSAQYEHVGLGFDLVASEQSQLLKKIALDLNVNLLLIPHVICPWSPGDDDFKHLEMIHNQLAADLAGRVALLPAGIGAQKTKGFIAQCDALIAARMHCAVAGVSSAVPTLFLSYSKKAFGMARYVYGNEEWVMPVSSDHDQIFQTINNLMKRRAEVKSLLHKRQDEFKQQSLQAGKLLFDLINRESLIND